MNSLPCAAMAAMCALLVTSEPRPALADEVDAAAANRSLTPYFAIEGQAGARVPLRRTDIDVKIAGVIADVVVRQRYQNDGATPINARYMFPASTQAAVYGMKMIIGSRVIEARIKERGEARQEFERAKREGKSASLLEQERPNLFSMNVANILPKEEISVELRYTELLTPTDGVYELLVPTVVGPRYGGGPGAAIGYLHQGGAPPSSVGLQVSVAGGMPIRVLESPSHDVAATWTADRSSASVALKDPATAGNRDFVLRYRLGGTELASGLLLYQGEKENFFLMMVQPPQRPAPELIPPREYVFIVDVSGSMTGFPLTVTKQLMRDLLTRLRPTDRFNLLLFAGDSRMYAPASVPANGKEIDAAIAYFDAQQSGGGTELLPAMQRALALPPAAPHGARSFVVITDGYISEEPALFEHIRQHLGSASVFSFGIGTSVNRHLIDGVAKAGQGEPFVVLNADEAQPVAGKFREYIETPVLTQVQAQYKDFEVYDVAPVALPDVYAQRPVLVFGKWRGAPRGKVSLTGVSGRGRFVNTFDVARFSPSAGNAALRYLWARTRVRELSDFSAEDAHREAIIKLGLQYNLLTRFTSFIAVHQVVRSDGKAADVEQPQPLPQGVSDEAVGMEVGAEPPLYLVLLLVLGVVAWRGRRAFAVRGAW